MNRTVSLIMNAYQQLPVNPTKWSNWNTKEEREVPVVLSNMSGIFRMNQSSCPDDVAGLVKIHRKSKKFFNFWWVMVKSTQNPKFPIPYNVWKWNNFSRQNSLVNSFWIKTNIAIWRKIPTFDNFFVKNLWSLCQIKADIAIWRKNYLMRLFAWFSNTVPLSLIKGKRRTKSVLLVTRVASTPNTIQCRRIPWIQKITNCMIRGYKQPDQDLPGSYSLE